MAALVRQVALVSESKLVGMGDLFEAHSTHGTARVHHAARRGRGVAAAGVGAAR